MNLTVGENTAYINCRPLIQDSIDEKLILCIEDKSRNVKKTWWLAFSDAEYLKLMIF